MLSISDNISMAKKNTPHQDLRARIPNMMLFFFNGMIFLWPNAGGKLWIVEIHQGYALSVLRRHWVLPRRSANEPALSSLDYLGLGNEENGLYTSCTYINMSVFMCIYIYIYIYTYMHSFIHLFAYSFFIHLFLSLFFLILAHLFL